VQLVCFFLQDFQRVWSSSTNVTDGQTDGRTTCNLNTALCTIYVSRGKNSHRFRILQQHREVHRSPPRL